MMKRLIRQIKRKYILKKFNRYSAKELENLHFFQKFEKELMNRNDLSREEYQEYLLLLSVVKQSAYQNYLKEK